MITMNRLFIYVVVPIVSGYFYILPTYVYAVLQPYQQGETALYLQSWETHQYNAQQSMVDDMHTTQRQIVQSVCTELVPSFSSGNSTNSNSTALEHVVVATTTDDGTVSYQELQEQCKTGTEVPIICVIPTGITVRIKSAETGVVASTVETRTVNSTTIHVILSVHALVIRGGTLQWYSAPSTGSADDGNSTTSSSSSPSATSDELLPVLQQQHAVLCAGYIAVELGGVFSVTNGYDPNDSNEDDSSVSTSRQKTVDSNNIYASGWKLWIYIRDNGARHPLLGSRVLGAVGTYSNANSTTTITVQSSDSSSFESQQQIQQPQIIIRDRSIELVRSWSLLATSISVNDTFIRTIHDPIRMGWKIGDRIAIAPFADRAQGSAQTFIISNFLYTNGDESATNSTAGTTAQIQLNRPSLYEFRGRTMLNPSSKEVINDSSEVINLSRNTVITGDDFTEIPCDPTIVSEVFPGFTTSTDGCMCSEGRASCTVGLHTVHMYGGTTQVDNVRIEYCGQRGIEGKYCTHFHHLNHCPDCQLIDNAIEYSQQRGIVVHDTHQSRVESNVLYNVRGANIYLEDGNEMYNRIAYNVAICPWIFTEGGCTVPGTSNDQGDTSLNQAGIYMENPTNDLIGNRMVNHFNGMFLNPTNGHGPMEAKICTNHMPFGHWEGNTFHSSGRFGTYGLNDNYPLKSTTNDIESFTLPSTALPVGTVDDAANLANDCSFLTYDGHDNGRPTTFYNSMDYGNAFVGHYNAGDIQYYGHSSMNNLNNIYWKETKSFQDECSAHISHSYFVNGTMALPDTIGSFIIEHSTLQQILLSVNHHCGIGVTGFLCMPHYILDKVVWIDDNIANTVEQRKWVSFTDSNNADSGGIVSIAPNTAEFLIEPNTTFFPDGYISLVSGVYPFLLNTGFCTLSGDLGYGVRYDHGILCTKMLQTFRVYSNGTDEYPILVQVYNQSDSVVPIGSQEIPVYYRGGKKRGYKFPVLPDDGLFYRLSLIGATGNLPINWFIDFGDIAMSNRYGVETIQIEIQGRTCSNGIIQSNHDRLYLSTSNDNSLDNLLWGHGACTDNAATSVTDCASNSSSVTGDIIHQRGCPELCIPTDCESIGAFCHCLLAQCQCLPGRYGPMCEYDLCSKCNDSAGCASKFLGSTLHVSFEECICEDGRTSEHCQTATGAYDGLGTMSPTPTEISRSPTEISQAPDNGSSQPKNIQFGTSASNKVLFIASLIASTLLIWLSMCTPIDLFW